MNYSKAMIDLVMEIRRHAPREDKPGIKLANPELLNDLIPLYHASFSTVFKTLVKDLFALAGDDWQSTLLNSEPQPEKDFSDNAQPLEQAEAAMETAPAPRHQRMYRGQPVYN